MAARALSLGSGLCPGTTRPAKAQHVCRTAHDVPWCHLAVRIGLLVTVLGVRMELTVLGIQMEVTGPVCVRLTVFCNHRICVVQPLGCLAILIICRAI